MPQLHSTRAPAQARPAGAPARPQAVSDLPLPIGDGSPRAFDLRFDDFCDYAETARGLSGATIRAYRDAFRNFRKFLLQSGSPLSLAVFAIDEWVRWNRRRGLGVVSTNSYWRALRAFFTDLDRRDGIPSPFVGVRPPPLPSRLPKALEPAACRRVLAAAEGLDWPSTFARARAVAIVSTFLYAGLRRGELLHLTNSDVNLRDGLILVRDGKGRGGGKDRVVYLPPQLASALQIYVRERDRRRIDSAGFFCTHTGTPISLSTLRRIHTRIQRAAGLKTSIHSYRHSYVSGLLRSGIGVHVARELAGHSSLSTTLGYLRVFDGDKRREVRKLSFD